MQRNKKLLILDLDNTLVYTHNNPSLHYDILVDGIYIKKRPYLDKFLEIISNKYDIAVFSSADRLYIQSIVKSIINYPLKFVYSQFMCKDHRYQDRNGVWRVVQVKDLSIVWDNFQEYSKENTLILDDSEDSYILNKDNAIPIGPYEGELDDVELERIMGLLK